MNSFTTLEDAQAGQVVNVLRELGGGCTVSRLEEILSDELFEMTRPEILEAVNRLLNQQRVILSLAGRRLFIGLTGDKKRTAREAAGPKAEN